MSTISRVCANTCTFFDATFLNVFYQICDPGIPRPCFLLKIINTSDVNVLVSYDGVYGNDVVLARNEIVLPFQENGQQPGHVCLMAKGTPVYLATATVPGKGGAIYVISYYQPVII
jgi:hypothetical protein